LIARRCLEAIALTSWSDIPKLEIPKSDILNRTSATARSSRAALSRADRFDAVYLRAAQAYMLISMPTGTSTIFGVFQVIRDSSN
jgi:hypothetical protein